MGGNLIKAEYKVIAQVVCELLWLKKLLEGLRLSEGNKLSLYCDNITAINIAQNPVQHDQTKHIEIDRHFIKEKLTTSILNLVHVTSDRQLVDIFTKRVNNRTYHNLVYKLGMCVSMH